MNKEAIAIKALEALARLGNGDQYGNSAGNEIARTALSQMAEQPQQGLAWQQELSGGWLQNYDLLYRLTEGPRPYNRDEIKVRMVDGSFSKEARCRRAGELLDRLRAPQPAQQEPVAHFGSAYVNANGVHVTTIFGPVAIPQDAKLYTTPQAQRVAIAVVEKYEAAHGIKENT